MGEEAQSRSTAQPPAWLAAGACDGCEWDVQWGGAQRALSVRPGRVWLLRKEVELARIPGWRPPLSPSNRVTWRAHQPIVTCRRTVGDASLSRGPETDTRDVTWCSLISHPQHRKLCACLAITHRCQQVSHGLCNGPHFFFFPVVAVAVKTPSSFH